ncbi:hypothetical protein G6556_04855, partial [Cellulomonas sp. IC4_254]|nr:hypothetical protein [Cellulomonas sp. IC4_254]
MLQRLIAAVLGVLGVAAIGLGVASATVWRADDPLVATAAPGGDTRTLVTDPGVLELAGDPVTVTVRADGSPVVLAVGRDTDVTAWVGTDAYERVTGLSDWHTLATTAGQDAAQPTADPSASATADAAGASPSPSASGAADATAVQAADPTGNDMWVVEVTGDGSATLEWPAQEGRWSLLAVSLGDSAPVLDLSWPQTVTTPWLWPGVALGVLLLAVAAILLVRILRQRREGPDAGWTDVSTGTLATVPLPGAGATHAAGASAGAGTPTGAIPVGTVTPGVPPTRRQLREAEAAAAAARKRGGRTPTGSLPVVTGVTPAVTGATPVVTGATPVVTGPTPAVTGPAPTVTGATSPATGATPPVTSATPTGATTATGGTSAATPGTDAPRTAGGATRPVDGAPARGAEATAATPAAPATPAGAPAAAAGTGSGARADATTTLPVTPAAPTAPSGARPAQPEPDADATGEAQAGRTGSGREGRTLADRLPWRRGRAAHPEPGTGTPQDAPAGPASSPSGAGPTPPAASSWAPVPGSAP